MSTKLITCIAIFLHFLNVAIAFPQDQAKADTLIAVFNKLSKEDTSRLSVLTLIAQNQNDPKLRLQYAEILMKEARENQDQKFLHHAYLQQGQAYRLMGDFEIAIYALFKALDYAEQCSFENGIAGTNTALADVYSLIGDNANAVSYYGKSISYLRQHDSLLLANTLLNLGDEYYMSKIYDSALDCFEESKLIYQKLGNDPAGLAYNLGNIGLVYAELNDLTKAEANIQASILALTQLDDQYGKAIFLSYLAEIYQKKGLLVEAKNLTDSSMSIARRYGLKSEMRDNSLRLADIYAMSSDFETAYRFHQEYVALKDSIANNDIYTRIENLKSAFDLAKKQSEVNEKQSEVILLTAEKKNQEIVIASTIAIAVMLTILAVVIFFYYRSKAKVNSILEEQKRSLESLNKTKDKYFSIISHDLRGSVSSFYGISRMIKQFVDAKEMNQLLEVADDVDHSVERLSTLLDNLLSWAMQQQEKISILPEGICASHMVNDIVDTLSNLSKGKNIEIKTDIEQGLKIYADKNTMMTVLRNLLSNSLKFTPEGGSILIKGFLKSERAELIVADTGIGIKTEDLETLFRPDQTTSTYGTSGEKGLGLGLQLVYEFMGLNKGEVEVKSEVGKGTSFRLILPKG